MAGLWKAYKEGGVLMMSIILMWSIFTIGIIIERALYLYGSSINKDVFLAFKNGDPYAIYYAPYSKTLLSAEWLGRREVSE